METISSNTNISNLVGYINIYPISLKKEYWKISKTIYEKHGSRKTLNKMKSQKIMNKKSSNKQFELDLNL